MLQTSKAALNELNAVSWAVNSCYFELSAIYERMLKGSHSAKDLNRHKQLSSFITACSNPATAEVIEAWLSVGKIATASQLSEKTGLKRQVVREKLMLLFRNKFCLRKRVRDLIFCEDLDSNGQNTHVFYVTDSRAQIDSVVNFLLQNNRKSIDPESYDSVICIECDQVKPKHLEGAACKTCQDAGFLTAYYVPYTLTMQDSLGGNGKDDSSR